MRMCKYGCRKALVAAFLLAASSPTGAWLPVLPRGHAMLRPWWLLRREHHPQQQPSHDSYEGSGAEWSLRSGIHRAAGALKAANEEPPSNRLLDALPLPLLPSPFNATLVGLLGGTPSQWFAGGKKDWSVTGRGTDPPSSATRTYSSPQIPTPAGGRSCCISQHPLCRAGTRLDCSSVLFLAPSLPICIS
jgi:hypothetical protein